MPKIVNNTILYPTHTVVCDKEVATTDYMLDMLFELTEDGTPEQHLQQLEDVNNDGSWTIVVNTNGTESLS